MVFQEAKMGRKLANRDNCKIKWTRSWMSSMSRFLLFAAVAAVAILLQQKAFVRSVANNDGHPEDIVVDDVRGDFPPAAVDNHGIGIGIGNGNVTLPVNGIQERSSNRAPEKDKDEGQVAGQGEGYGRQSTVNNDNGYPLCDAVCYPYKGKCLSDEESGDENENDENDSDESDSDKTIRDDMPRASDETIAPENPNDVRNAKKIRCYETGGVGGGGEIISSEAGGVDEAIGDGDGDVAVDGIIDDNETTTTSTETTKMAARFCHCTVERQPPYTDQERYPCSEAYNSDKGLEKYVAETACREACPVENLNSDCTNGANGFSECKCQVNLQRLYLSDAREMARGELLCPAAVKADDRPCRRACPHTMRGFCDKSTAPLEGNRPSGSRKKRRNMSIYPKYTSCKCLAVSGGQSMPLSKANAMYPPTTDPCGKRWANEQQREDGCREACGRHQGRCRELFSNRDKHRAKYCICRRTSSSSSSSSEIDYFAPSLTQMRGLPNAITVGRVMTADGHRDPCHANKRHLCHGWCHASCSHGTEGACEYFKKKIGGEGVEGGEEEGEEEEGEEEEGGKSRPSICICRLHGAVRGMTLPVARKDLGEIQSNGEFRIPCEWNQHKDVCAVVCRPHRGHCTNDECKCSPHLVRVVVDPCADAEAGAENRDEQDRKCEETCPDEMTGRCTKDGQDDESRKCVCKRREIDDGFDLQQIDAEKRSDILCNPHRLAMDGSTQQLGVLCSAACPNLMPARCHEIGGRHQCQCRMHDEGPVTDHYVTLDKANRLYPPTDDPCAKPSPDESEAACDRACKSASQSGKHIVGQCCSLTNDHDIHLLVYCFCRLSSPDDGDTVHEPDVFLSPADVKMYLDLSKKSPKPDLSKNSQELTDLEWDPEIAARLEDYCTDYLDEDIVNSDCDERCPKRTHGFCRSLTVENRPKDGHCICKRIYAIRGWTLSVAKELFGVSSTDPMTPISVRR